MIESVGRVLHDLPVLSLFFSILLGTIIGRFHFKGVGFGSVVGTLIAGIIIGIVAKPDLPDMLRWSFFYLFLFSIGYSVGPQFFGSLKKEALPQIALAVVVAVSGLAAVVAVTAIFGFDEGLAVGVLSGAMTQSAALGTGLSAIAELPIPEDAKAALIANAPLADAITYGFGDLGLILFLTWLGPKIMRADLKREAKELEKELSAGKGVGEVPSATHYGIRAYRLGNAQLAGSTLAALEGRYATARLSVQRVKRGAAALELRPTLTLNLGDELVVSARRAAFLQAERDIGPEVDDDALLSVPVRTAAVVVTNSDVSGKTIGELALDPNARGVYLESVQRSTELIPREPWTVLQRGDILRIVGSPDDVERAGRYVGFVERDLSKTDLTFLAGGVCAGILLGLLKLNAAGIVLGLGTAGSILVIGLIGGWAQPLPCLRRDTGTSPAPADGYRTHRLHRGGGTARRTACGGGVSRQRRRLLCDDLLRRGDRDDRSARGRNDRCAVRLQVESADDPRWSRRGADVHAWIDGTPRCER